jgi:predicted RND superfamily exporter protein
MKNIRNRIDTWFEAYAHVIYRNRIKTIAIMLVLTAALVFQIPKITIDTSTEGFLHADDPSLLAYNNFRDQFGRDEVIIIAIKSKNIFSQSFLKTIQRLHEELGETVPYIDDITSIVNARNTRGEADELIVEDLLDHWPQTKSQMTALKKRVLSNPLYKNLLISEDTTLTTIIIKTHCHSSLGDEIDVLEGFEEGTKKTFNGRTTAAVQQTYLTDKENSQVVYAIQGVVEKYQRPNFRIYIGGSPVVTHILKHSLMTDLRRFMVLTVAAIAILLYVMFHRISGVILPLVIVLLSLLSTIGIMALVGVAIKVPTQILPSFLLAVGVGTSVHILSIFYHHLEQAKDKEQAIVYALSHSGLAVVMTNVTTASGLMSFSTSEVAPIADLGLFAGFGVLLTFIYTLVLLPAILAFLPISGRNQCRRQIKHTLMDRFLSGVSGFSTSHPVRILIASFSVMGLSILAASQIRFSHDILRWFPAKSQIRQATEKIDNELRGSLNLEVIIETGQENGLYQPALLNRIEKATVYTESLKIEDLFVGKAWSLTTILKEINQALNENRSSFYAIPQNSDLIAQEFLLFENSGSDDLEDVVDSQFSTARFTIKCPFKDAVKYDQFTKTVNRYFTENFTEARITLTGMIALLSQTINNSIISMARSYIIAMVVITILMIVLIGRLRIGLLSMVPNLTPILLMLGVIGITPIKMDLFTMMIASIAIGLAVDDTIHFMHNFRRYYEKIGDPKQSVFETLHTTGRAMLVTTIVLSIGFFIFIFASMRNLFAFGVLTAFTIIMALVTDYLVAPALMVLVNRPQTKSAEE